MTPIQTLSLFHISSFFSFSSRLPSFDNYYPQCALGCMLNISSSRRTPAFVSFVWRCWRCASFVLTCSTASTWDRFRFLLFFLPTFIDICYSESTIPLCCLGYLFRGYFGLSLRYYRISGDLLSRRFLKFLDDIQSSTFFWFFLCRLTIRRIHHFRHNHKALSDFPHKKQKTHSKRSILFK